MYPYNDRRPAPPTHIAAMLVKQLDKAKAHIDGLQKSAFLAYSDEQLVKQVVQQYTFQPLKLSKQDVQIEENKNLSRDEIPYGESFYLSGENYRDVVYASWSLSGSGDLIGLRDSNGYSLGDKRNGPRINERYVCTVGLKTNPNAMQGVKAQIDQSAAQFQAHIDSLNAEAEAFAKGLPAALLPLISEKRKSLDLLKSAEDFLNS